MLDVLHIYVTKILVPQEKKLLGRSQFLFSSERNQRLTLVGEADSVALWARAT